MNKTQEELNQLKQEYETLNDKLKELSEDELKEVAGGTGDTTFPYYFCEFVCPKCGGIHQVGFWFMDNGLGDSEPHVQKTCDKVKVDAITYRGDKPMIRLNTLDLVDFKVTHVRSAEGEWMKL